MKVLVRPFFSQLHEVELEQALEPPGSWDASEGAIETLQAEVDALRGFAGRLLAHMVETEILTLEQASDMAGLDKPPEPAWES